MIPEKTAAFGYDLNKVSNNVRESRHGLGEEVAAVVGLASGRCLQEKVATALGVDSWRGAVSLMRRGRLKQASITGDSST